MVPWPEFQEASYSRLLWSFLAWSESEDCWRSVTLIGTNQTLFAVLLSIHWWYTCSFHPRQRSMGDGWLNKQEKQCYLSRNSNLLLIFVADRRSWAILIVEDDCDTRLFDPGLTLFIDQILQGRSSQLWYKHSSHDLEWITLLKTWMPRRKQIESRMLLFPLPFKPVMALNSRSHPEMTVRVAYDLKPSTITSSMNMMKRLCKG